MFRIFGRNFWNRRTSFWGWICFVFACFSLLRWQSNKIERMHRLDRNETVVNRFQPLKGIGYWELLACVLSVCQCTLLLWICLCGTIFTHSNKNLLLTNHFPLFYHCDCINRPDILNVCFFLSLSLGRRLYYDVYFREDEKRIQMIAFISKETWYQCKWFQFYVFGHGTQ